MARLQRLPEHNCGHANWPGPSVRRVSLRTIQLTAKHIREVLEKDRVVERKSKCFFQIFLAFKLILVWLSSPLASCRCF